MLFATGALLVAAVLLAGATGITSALGDRSTRPAALALPAARDDAFAPAPPLAPSRPAPPVASAAPAATDPVAGPSAGAPAASAAPSPRTTTLPRPSPAASVAPLGTLQAPSALVSLGAPVSDAQLAAVRALPAVTALDVVDTGRLTVGGRDHPALGVDPSTFRAWVPLPSARSDALWQSVARGELVVAYGDDAPPRADLGRPVAVRGNGTRQVRLGAFAALGLQQAGVLVGHDRAAQVGLAPRSGLLVSAGQVEPGALASRLAAATGGQVTLLGAAAVAAQAAPPAPGGRALSWRQLYQQAAATCPGLSWTVLAAIGQVESGHGRNNGPSSAGAVGPMQFLPSTFALVAVDGDHDGRLDPWDAYDAVPTAARLLCQAGAGQGGAGLQRAVFSYNHAQWYVDEVLALAARYR